MPLELRGPFNSISIPLAGEQPPLHIPVAGGGFLTLRLLQIGPSRFVRFIVAGSSALIAQASATRAARTLIYGSSSASLVAGGARRARALAVGATTMLPRADVARGTRTGIEGESMVLPRAGAVRRGRVVISAGSALLPVVVQFAPVVDESGCIVVPQVPSGSGNVSINAEGCIVMENIA